MVLAMPRPVRVKGSQHPVARKVVPVALRPIIGKTEFRKALRGTSAEIKRLHAETMADWERQLETARAQLEGRAISVPAHEIDAACGVVYRDATARARQEARIDPVAWELTFDGLVERATRYDNDEYEFTPSSSDLAEADEMLRAYGIVADAGSLVRAATRLWETKVGIARLMERRAEGDWGPDRAAGRYPDEPPKVATAEPKAAEVTFQELTAAWGLDAGHVIDGDRISRPYYERLKTIARFEAFVKHNDARAVTRAEAVNWKTDLLRAKLAANTIATQISKLSAIWTFGVKHGLVSENPFAGLTPSKRGHEQRRGRKRPYTVEEAASLLEAARSETGLLRWLPSLLYYTGARLSEVAEAATTDLKQRDGIWVLSVTDADESSDGARRTVKNESSIRDIPIHPALAAEGFIAFVQSLPRGPIFRDVKPDAVFGKRGVAAQKIFARWVRRQGIDDPKVSPAHSLRHLFIDLARRVGIRREVRDAITGHHTSINEADSYGLGVRSMVTVMKDAVSKIPVPEPT